MSSLRNIDEGRETPERILDAAKELILSVGWRRTTFTDIARRAGVSRMTVYRAYPDIATLFGDLMTREWADIAETVTAGEITSPDDLAGVVVGTIGALRADRLFQRILDVDPDILLPYLLDRRGRTQDAFIELLSSRIKQGQAVGAVRLGDADLMARSLLLAAHGSLLSAHTMTDRHVSLEALDQALRELVARYVAP